MRLAPANAEVCLLGRHGSIRESEKLLVRGFILAVPILRGILCESLITDPLFSSTVSASCSAEWTIANWSTSSTSSSFIFKALRKSCILSSFFSSKMEGRNLFLTRAMSAVARGAELFLLLRNAAIWHRHNNFNALALVLIYCLKSLNNQCN